MSSLEDLLAVQALDTRVHQLRHRRDTLPARASLTDARTSLAAAEAEEQAVAERLRSIRAAQKEAEDHASLLEDKAAEVDRSLYDGSVSAHKELEALQAEHRMLKEHQAEHEDQALEMMEQAEPVESELAERSSVVEQLRGDVERFAGEVAEAEADLDSEIDGVLAERAAAAAEVPEETLAAYETLRRQLGGIAVARLVGARCEGCHLEIPSAQLEELRRAPEDELVHCPECFRILVR